MAQEYSFDIVSKVDRQELSNAIDLTKKELDNRFDFKGCQFTMKIDKDQILIDVSDEMHMKQLIDSLQGKIVKRGMNLKAFKFGKLESNISGAVKCKVDIQNGLTQEQSKKITTLIRDSKIKVQARIEGEKIRITGKDKDDLQAVQKAIRDANYEFDASFDNYR